MNLIPVDIILCCYNQEQYIAKAIESILLQDVKGLNVRLIVADDCSLDKTLEIIKKYEGKSPFEFCYLLKEYNLGLTRNYQQAFNEVREDGYTAILEGDDYWSSTKHLQQHIQALEAHKRYSMSINTIQFLEEKDGLKPVNWAYGKEAIHSISLKDYFSYGNPLGNLSACVFRSRHLKQLPDKLFDMNIADWEIGMCVVQNGPVAYLKDSTSVYFVKDSGVWCKNNAEERKRSRLDTIEKMDEFFNRKYHKYLMKFAYKVENSLPLSIPIQKNLKTRLKSLIFNKIVHQQ